MIAIEEPVVKRHINRAGFFGRLLMLDIPGERPLRVIPKDLQTHPVTDLPVHLDFVRVTAGAELTVPVAVVFENEDDCPGLRAGGVLDVVRYEIEVICQPDAIPESVTVDLSGLEVGETIHISAVTLPEGVRPAIDDRDFTIATITAPTTEPEPEEEGEAAEEAGEEAEAGEGESAGEEDEQEE